MFTGLIEEIGIIRNLTNKGLSKKISVKAIKILDDLKIDDSVSINGVCQTVIDIGKDFFVVDSVEETIRKTTFRNLKTGSEVNLERAMKLGDRLGGHLVQGHVECIGIVKSIIKEQSGILVSISTKEDYKKYIVNLGSICLDGVSLTIAGTENNYFTVAVIPHTWEMTIFKNYKTGTELNIEFDIIGKYVESLMKNDNNLKNYKKTDFSHYIDQPDF